MIKHQSRFRRSLSVEILEDRAIPATFGIPWADPSRLSLSFVPDGTAIAGHASALFKALDAQMPRATWQQAVVSAFRTWSVHVNMDISVVRDTGQPVGVAGFAQHDPRFGDVRIAAHDMGAGALAVAAPNDPALADTLSGDLFLNSAVAFNGNPYDLYSVVLHEAGHALGLDHSTNPASPMYNRFNNTKKVLTPADIAALQSLYGVRQADRFEGAAGNQTAATSAALPRPISYDGDTPLVAFGDITRPGDVDYFRIDLPDDDDDDDDDDYTGGLTVHLQTSGISVLAPRLTIYDRDGRLLQTRQSTSVVGDTLSLRLQVNAPGAWPYTVRVEAAPGDLIGVGGYGLAVRYDALSSASNAAIDRVLRAPNTRLGPDAIDALFRDPLNTFFNPDEGKNETPGTATPLTTTPGYTRGTHFETVASIESTSDRDHYRFQLPAVTANRVLTVTAWTNDSRRLIPRLTIRRPGGALVPARVLNAGDGRFTLQIPDAQPNAQYIVEVSGGDDKGMGNYYLNAHLGARASQIENYLANTLNDSRPTLKPTLYVARSQLFHFVLTAKPIEGLPDAQLRMTITSTTGRRMLTLLVRAGDVISRGVFLTPGAYTVQIHRVNVPQNSGYALGFTLSGSDITDPIGPVVSDPTLKPLYTTPKKPGSYTYPSGAQTTKPYNWASVAM